MISGIGIDICEIDRIEQAQVKNEKFAERVLTPKELAIFNRLTGHRRYEFLAGRYAAKEAYSKAYGTGIGKLSFLDIEVLPNDKGQPQVTKNPFLGRAFVSISHSREVAIAQVILEAEN